MKNKNLIIKTGSFWILTFLLTAHCSLFTIHCLYAAGEGTATATFLRLEQGARALGMGGAFTAIADNSDGIYYNPAGIAQIRKDKELAFTYSSMYQDISCSFLSFATPTSPESGSGTFGMGVTYLTVDGIEKTDSSGNKLGDMSIYNMAATLAYATKSDGLSIGIAGKYIQQDYDVQSGGGYAGDAGFIIELTENTLFLGASALNIGPKAKIGDVKNKLPMNLRAGIAYKPTASLTLATDLEQPNDADNKIHAGIEFAYNPMLSVRAGYKTIKNLSNAGLTAGVGIKSEVGKGSGKRNFVRRASTGSSGPRDTITVCFDYAYVSYGDFDATHRITVGLKF
ncbi:MAG: PorV/PorQ family protein [Elusimicrobia bacterium]|nr:PorV/PorQ family protein [Elusimicrobiota bacterium]